MLSQSYKFKTVDNTSAVLHAVHLALLLFF